MKRLISVLLVVTVVCSSVFANGTTETKTATADFPSKALTYIVCFAPGGESDVTARMQQDLFEKISGQKFVVEYKEGGGGAVGWSELLNRPADGYTIAGTNEPHTIVQPLQRKNAGYETEDLVRICQFQYTSVGLAVLADSPYDTLEDFIQYCKDNPGKMVIGGSGTWSSTHIPYLLLSKFAGIDCQYVAYSGSGDMKSDLLGGHVPCIFATVTQAVEFGDKVKILAFASEERLNLFPNVPTFREKGYDIVEGSYRGIAAPKGTPKEVVDKLAAIFKQINEDPEFSAKMTSMGFDLIFRGPEDYDKFIAERKEVYKQLIAEFSL